MYKRWLATFLLAVYFITFGTNVFAAVSVRVSSVPSVRVSAPSSAPRVSSSSVSKPTSTSATKSFTPSTVVTSSGASVAKVGFAGPKNNTFAFSESAPKPTTSIGTKNAYAQKVSPNTPVKQGFMGTSMFDKKSAVDMKISRANESKKALTAETTKYKQQVSTPYTFNKSSPVFTTRSNTPPPAGGYRVWKTHREHYYQQRNWTPPTFIYIGQPYYGHYHSQYMWSNLDNINDEEQMRLAYHHMQTEEFQKWREDVKKAGVENPEVLAKLNAMDAKLSAITEPKNPDYVSTKIPAVVMYSDEALEQMPKDAIPTVYDSGSKGGVYHRYCQFITNASKDVLDIKENMEPDLYNKVQRYMRGESDMFSGPVDGISLLTKYNTDEFKKMTFTTIPMYKEVIVMISSKKGPVDEMSDLNETNNIITSIKNSGTDIMWKNFVDSDKKNKYNKVNVVNMSFENPDNENGVFGYLEKHPNTVIVFQGGLNSDFLKAADAQAAKYNLRLINMDADFIGDIQNTATKEPLYSEVTIPSDKFKNLQHGFLFNHSIDAYVIDSVLVISNKWKDANGEDVVDELVANSIIIQDKVESYVNGYEL